MQANPPHLEIAQPAPERAPLPPVVVLIGWLLIVWGSELLLHAVAVGIDLAFPSPFTPTFASHFAGFRAYLVPLRYSLAFAQMVIGIALLRRKHWARAGTIAILVLSLISTAWETLLVPGFFTHFLQQVSTVSSLIFAVGGGLILLQLFLLVSTLALFIRPQSTRWRWLTFPHLPPAIAFIGVYLTTFLGSALLMMSAVLITQFMRKPSSDNLYLAGFDWHAFAHVIIVIITMLVFGLLITAIVTLTRYTNATQLFTGLILVIGICFAIYAALSTPITIHSQLAGREAYSDFRTIAESSHQTTVPPFPPPDYDFHAVVWVYAVGFTNAIYFLLLAFFLNLMRCVLLACIIHEQHE